MIRANDSALRDARWRYTPQYLVLQRQCAVCSGLPTFFIRLRTVLMSLLDRYGIDTERQEQRKQFLLLTSTDGHLVSELQPWSGTVAEELAEQFYRHLLSHPDSATLLSTP